MGEGSTGAGLWHLLRPKQWLKNGLVFAAPFAAGEILRREVAGRTLLAFAAMCMVASATYVVNDLRDVEADRQHPVKRNRPLASGVVPAAPAVAIAIVVMAGGLAAAALVNYQTLALVGVYIATTLSYSLGIKRVPVVEMVVLAAGFVLRGLIGAAAAGVPVSQWFFVVLSAGSILIVAAKRDAELMLMGPDTPSRAVLKDYSHRFLTSVQTATLAVALIGYCLWAFDSARQHDSAATANLFRASVAPFATAALRFLQLGEGGKAGAPEDLISDRILLGCAVVWGAVYALGVALGH